MLKKVGFGAAFALTVAAVAIGCGDDKTTIIQGGGGELGNTDNFPASSIKANDVSEDGGGFTGNNQIGRVANTHLQVQFNTDRPDSENSGAASASSTARGDAMVNFRTEPNPNQHQRIHLSHFDGSTFTRPQEITGADRIDNLNGGPVPAGPNPFDDRGTHINSVCMIPLNTSGYVSPGGQQAQDALVRANAGNWLIVWDAQTLSQDPRLSNPNNLNDSLAAADANGSHHTLYATMFLSSLRNQATAMSSLVGNTSTTGTPNGTPLEFRNGFQVRGTEIPNNRGGASAGKLGGNATVAEITDSVTGDGYRPAEDVISYGIASDTLVGEAAFGTALVNAPAGVTEPTGLTGVSQAALLTFNPRLGNVGGGTFITGPTRAMAGGVGATNTTYAIPGAARYSVGDDTTFVQLFYTQLITSHGGATSVTLVPTGSSVAAIELGPAYEFKTANFNLASMTFGTPANVPFPVAADRSVGANAGIRHMAMQPLGEMRVYNNLVFWRYADASISGTRNSGISESADLVAHSNPVGAAVGRNDSTTAMAVLSVTAGAQGTATLNNTQQFDVTFRGTGNRHSQANTSDFNSIAVTHPGNEFVRFLDCPTRSIYGSDEGLTDVTAFLLGRNTTNVAAVGTDEDQQLWAVGVNTNGTLVPAGSGANPVRVSVHQTEPAAAGASTAEPFGIAGSTGTAQAASNSANRDDAFDVKTVMSRDGTYVVVAFRQSQALSPTANLGLMAQVYKTSRAVAVVGSGSGTATNFDVRFPTAGPVQVNNPASTVYNQTPNRSVANGPTISDGLTGSPVAAYDFQGALGYRCSFQSDRTRLSLLWLTADDTEDRLWVRQLQVGTGTVATDRPTLMLGTEAELDGTATGQGSRVLGGGRGPADQFAGTNNVLKVAGSNYRFLVGTHGYGTASVFGGGIGVPTNANGLAISPQRCSSLNDGPDRVLSHDAGPNTAGAGGEVLIAFSKVVDATTTDGDFFDRKIFASLYTGTAITDRVAVSRNIDENALTGGAFVLGVFVSAFDTQLNRLIGTPRSASLSTANLGPTNGVIILMTAPFGDNNSSQTSVFSRRFRARTQVVTGGTAPTFATQFTPTASAATTDATFVAPTRLDRDLNSVATIVDSFTKGTQVLVVIQQDDHLWGAITNDGDTWTNNNGLPEPFLIDNNFSSGVSGVVYGSAHKTDSNCDDISGSFIAFEKLDVNQQRRVFIRTLN